MKKLRSILRTVFTFALAAGMMLSWSLQQAFAANSVASEATRATEYTTQIERSLMAIEDGRRQVPRDRWDPQYIVDTVGIDPAALYNYVRENVTWVPYRGQLRGPVGVLMDRNGNALDMSLLLADLFKRSGYPVRLAHAPLDAGTVEQIWAGFAAIAAAAPTVPPEGTDKAALPDGVSSETVQSIVKDAEPAPERKPEPAGSVKLAQDTGLGADSEGSGFGAMGGSGSMFEQVTGGGGQPTAVSDDEAAELYELDKAVAEEQLRKALDSRTQFANELDQRTYEQGKRLLSMFRMNDDGQQVAYEQARAKIALADHWWVQAEINGAWTDYDLLSPQGVGTAIAAAAQTFAPDAIPADQVHRVQLRVVAEQLINGKLRENKVFDHEMVASQMTGKKISLRHLPMLWPSDWAAVTPDDVQEKLFAALLTQKEWMPALTIGEDAFQQSGILDTGAVNPNPEPKTNPFLQIAFPAAGKVGRVADLFDSLLEESATPEEKAAMDAATAEKARLNGELTAEWLEYTILVPGEKPKTVRREIFDIIGPAMRRAGDFKDFVLDEDKRLARAGGEMTETEIVILPCWPASEYLADKTAELALANKPLLNEFTRDPFGKSPPNSIELFSKMSGMAGPALLYSMLRSEVQATANSVFVDRPQVIAQHGVLTRVGPGELTSKAALDVVENGVGADPFAADAFMLRMLQGVADTNAEAMALGEGDKKIGENVAEAFNRAASEPQWSVFFPDERDRIGQLGLTPDLTARLLAELEAGHAVVSPSGSAKDFEKAGWWRVDLTDGTTLGMGNRGWGSVLVEYAFYLTIQVMLAQISCMAFTAAAEDKIRGLTAEEGRDKIRTWAANCVSQALLETVAGLSTSWISSRFLEGAKTKRWDKKSKDGTYHPPSHTPSTNASHSEGSHSTTHSESSHSDSKPRPHNDPPPPPPPPPPPNRKPDPHPDNNRPRNDHEPVSTKRPPTNEPTHNEPNTRRTPPEPETASNKPRRDPFETETKDVVWDTPEKRARPTEPTSEPRVQTADARSRSDASTEDHGAVQTQRNSDSEPPPTQRNPNSEPYQETQRAPEGAPTQRNPNSEPYQETQRAPEGTPTQRSPGNEPEGAPTQRNPNSEPYQETQRAPEGTPTQRNPNSEPYQETQRAPEGTPTQRNPNSEPYQETQRAPEGPPTQRSPGNEPEGAPTQRNPNSEPYQETQRAPEGTPTQRSPGNEPEGAPTQRNPNSEPYQETQRAPEGTPTRRSPGNEPEGAPTQRNPNSEPYQETQRAPEGPSTQRNPNSEPYQETQRAPEGTPTQRNPNSEPYQETRRAPEGAPTQRNPNSEPYQETQRQPGEPTPSTQRSPGNETEGAPTQRNPNSEPYQETQRAPGDSAPPTKPGVGPGPESAPTQRMPNSDAFQTTQRAPGESAPPTKPGVGPGPESAPTQRMPNSDAFQTTQRAPGEISPSANSVPRPNTPLEPGQSPMANSVPRPNTPLEPGQSPMANSVPRPGTPLEPGQSPMANSVPGRKGNIDPLGETAPGTQRMPKQGGNDPAMADTATPGTQRMPKQGSNDPAMAETAPQQRGQQGSKLPPTDAERVSQIKPATDERVAAQQRYKDAEARYDADPSQANYDALDKANTDYNKAHMKELEAWNQAGGRGFPPTKDAGIQRPDTASTPGRTTQAGIGPEGGPVGTGTKPGMGPEGVPGRTTTPGMGPEGTPGRTTQPGMGPEGGPIGTGTKPGMGPDPAMADTATPGTQRMPKQGGNDPAMADTATPGTQRMPKQGSNDPAMADTATPGTQRMPKQGGNDPAMAETAPQQRGQQGSKLPPTDAERVSQIKPATDERVAAQQRYKDAEARYDADPSQANYDALDKANTDYNKAHMKELEAWNQAGGRGFPPTKDAGIQRPDAAPVPGRSTQAGIGPEGGPVGTGTKPGMGPEGTPGRATQPGIGPEHAPGNAQTAENGRSTQRGMGPEPNTPLEPGRSPMADSVSRPKTPLEPGRSPMADSVSRPKTPLEPGNSPMADSVSRPNRGDPAMADTATPGTQRMPKQGSNDPAMADTATPGTQRMPKQGGNDPAMADTATPGTQRMPKQGGNDPAMAEAAPQQRGQQGSKLPPTDAERVSQIKPATDERVAAQQRYKDAEARYDADPSQANYDALDKANTDYNKAHMKELEAWNQAGGRGFPPTKDAGIQRAEATPAPARTPTNPGIGPGIGPEAVPGRTTQAGIGPEGAKIGTGTQAGLGPQGTPARATQPGLGPVHAPVGTGTEAGLGPDPALAETAAPGTQRMARAGDPALADTATPGTQRMQPNAPTTPSLSPADAKRVEAIKPYTDDRVAAQQRYKEAEVRFDADQSQANYDALDRADTEYKRAHMRELDAWANQGGMGFPPTKQAALDPGYQPPAGFAQTAPAQPAPDIAFAKPVTTGMEGQSGANNTLAMGLANLTGIIQKGP